MSKASDLARFGVVQSGNIIERLSSPCDGSSVTVGSGTYTFQNVTAEQTLTTSFADVTGSSMAYTPPSIATRVEYEFNYSTAYVDAIPVTIMQFLIDSDVVTDGYLFSQASQWYSDRVTFRWVIHIGGSADTASGRLASWTSAKTLKLQANDYSSSNDNKLHRISYLNVDSAPLTIPTLSITAIR